MMPAYNAAAFIARAIESVLSQSFANWELIIVDDGSTDQGARIVEQIGDPRIRVTGAIDSAAPTTFQPGTSS